MRYATAPAFRAALEDRLKARAEQTGVTLVRLRKTVVFDRLLARLVAVAPGRWMLKGALALDFRFGGASRTTMDMDIGRADDESAATADLVAAQVVEVGDRFVFAIERTARLDQLREGVAVRYRAACELAGRRFDEVMVDVGFSRPPLAAPDVVRGPDLLAFASIEPLVVPALPLAVHVAEKVHAYTRGYGPAGVRSTRVKDLVDLVLISRSASFDAGTLRQALAWTFQERGAQSLPPVFPHPPGDWALPFRRMAGDAALTPDLAAGHRAAAAFLDPVLGAEVTGATWDAESCAWQLR